MVMPPHETPLELQTEFLRMHTGSADVRELLSKHSKEWKYFNDQDSSDYSVLFEDRKSEIEGLVDYANVPIVSQATFDFVLSVDSKYLLVTAEWGDSEDSDRPQNGDHLTDWLHIEDDVSCNDMISQAMLSGSFSRDGLFRRGLSMAPARCLCIIEPEDPDNMIMAVRIHIQKQVTMSSDVGYKKETSGSLRAALKRRGRRAMQSQRRIGALTSVSEDLEDVQSEDLDDIAQTASITTAEIPAIIEDALLDKKLQG